MNLDAWTSGLDPPCIHCIIHSFIHSFIHLFLYYYTIT